MASLKYHKDVKRWRVFWHVTLPDGTVDKGSRSFKVRQEGEKFKEKKEREEKLLKRAIMDIIYVCMDEDHVENPCTIPTYRVK